MYWITLSTQLLTMILHGNYKSSNTPTQTFFPLLRKILLILDRRNKSAHVRTCFTSCLNQFSCNMVNDQKLICRGSHHYGHFNKPCIKEYILYTVLCGFLICFYLSLYAGINTAILPYVPISLQSVPFNTHTHTKHTHILSRKYFLMGVTIRENNLVLSHPVVHSIQAK